jgi:hypothetical protein
MDAAVQKVQPLCSVWVRHRICWSMMCRLFMAGSSSSRTPGGQQYRHQKLHQLQTVQAPAASPVAAAALVSFQQSYHVRPLAANITTSDHPRMQMPQLPHSLPAVVCLTPMSAIALIHSPAAAAAAATLAAALVAEAISSAANTCPPSRRRSNRSTTSTSSTSSTSPFIAGAMQWPAAQVAASSTSCSQRTPPAMLLGTTATQQWADCVVPYVDMQQC